jgi:hypothetical protein
MFQLYMFGSTLLPTAAAEFGDDATATSGAVSTIGGGAYNAYGAETVQPSLPFTLTYTGLISGASLDAVRTESDALRGLVGTKATLYKRAVAGDYNLIQCQARAVAFKPLQPGQPIGNHQRIEIQFACLTRWESSPLTGSTVSLPVGGLTTTIMLDHSGGTREQPDVLMTLTAGSAAITMFGIDLPATHCSWRWTGTLAAGKSLVIDCGAMSILNDGVGSWAGMTMTGNHATAYWLVVPPNVVSEPAVIWTDNGSGTTAATLVSSFRTAYQ